jgi:hypothetical protein
MFISDASGLIAAGSIRDAQPMLRLVRFPSSRAWSSPSVRRGCSPSW